MSSLETPYDLLEESDLEDVGMKSKFTMVIRKPQEGKTFICTHDISSDQTNSLHIVCTMNTISASKQFRGRLGNEIGKDLIIEFNSNPSGDNPAKSIDDVLEYLKTNKKIKAIVCCAHQNKIREKIPKLLYYLSDSRKIYKIVIHIDEAHKYLIENRQDVRNFNDSTIVTRMIGYSGSPNGIWSTDKTDPLFYKIHIRDIEKEFGLIRSKEYFGVKDCDPKYSDPIQNDFPSEIPEEILRQSIGTRTPTLYDDKFPFTIGNEKALLAHIQSILPKMKIDPKKFSYHFAPSYTRKVTHYYTCSLILKEYPTSNVIVMNGNGLQLFRQSGQVHFTHDTTLESILEPSDKIEYMIRPYRSCPTWVTGFQCVGMSITLINQSLGNFDSVILDHSHYNRDILYQLCRFLFNYTSWVNKSIKKTIIYSRHKKVIDICLDYEKMIDFMIEHHSGESITLQQINGTEPDEPSQREIKKGELMASKHTLRWKRYKVYDKNDVSQWNEITHDYEKIREKHLTGRSRPTLSTQKKDEQDDSDVYYHCSTTTNVKKHSIEEIERLKDQSWWSTLQLVDGQFTYARIFVGYDCLDDPTQYTIYLKYVILEENEYNKTMLKKYGK